MQGNSRTLLRGVLFVIILLTTPCYVLGFVVWGRNADARNNARVTPTADAINPTWTPLGLDDATSTPTQTRTPSVTLTALSPLLPTPIQFLPPVRTNTPLPIVFPADTPAPTLTPNNDRDGDGVLDNVDECPNQWGTVRGCPDADGDGIPDKDDACPSTGGPASNSGCPVTDTDGDGIPDNLDQCPNQAGPASNGGCPPPADTDGDGIIDTQDACPNQAGPASNNGCPLPVDTDGDGIPDNLDECPNQAGLPIFNGCPDTDGDGIPDAVDQCPNEVGPASNNGCHVSP